MKARGQAVVFALVATAIALFSFSRQYFDRLANGQAGNAGEILVNEFSASFLAATLVFIVITIARRYSPAEPRHWLPYAIGFVPFALLHTLGMALSRPPLYRLFELGSYHYGDLGYRALMEAPVQALVYSATLLGFAAVQRLQRAREAERLQALLNEARLDQLRLSIAPHFLFNTLNTISAVAYEDAARADDLIGRLSTLLRALLRQDQAQMTTLNEELSLVHEYLEIQRARFEDRLQVAWSVAEDTGDCAVPFMILQPLVENALEHGASADGDVSIEIRACRRPGQLVLEIADRGMGPGAFTPGIGIGNTQRRIELLYGSAAEFRLQAGPNGGALARLTVPCR